jgi:hypothetical protein
MVGQSAWMGAVTRPLPGPEPAFVRDTVALTLFGLDGTLQDTIDVVPGREDIASMLVTGDAVNIFKRPAVFGRVNVFAAGGQGIWSSDAARFELRLHSADDGRLVRVLRAHGLERAPEDGLAERIRDDAMAEVDEPEARRRLEAWYDLSPRPGTQPPFDRILVDDPGRDQLSQFRIGRQPLAVRSPSSSTVRSTRSTPAPPPTPPPRLLHPSADLLVTAR